MYSLDCGWSEVDYSCISKFSLSFPPLPHPSPVCWGEVVMLMLLQQLTHHYNNIHWSVLVLWPTLHILGGRVSSDVTGHNRA